MFSAKHDKDLNYLSLLQNISINKNLPNRATKESPRGVTYYLHWLVHNALLTRIYVHYGLHFGSTKQKKSHVKYYRARKGTDQISSWEGESFEWWLRVRPQRVEALRQKELLCVMVTQELEWYAIDEVDFDVNLKEVAIIQKITGTPIFEEREPIRSDKTGNDCVFIRYTLNW